MASADHASGDHTPVQLGGLRTQGNTHASYRLAPSERPAGYVALLERHGITHYQPPHISYLHPKAFGARKSEITSNGGQREVFPGRTAVGDSDADHLAFALRYDGVDLEAMRLLLPRLDAKHLTKAISATPNSSYLRRVWCLYEWMMGNELPINGIEESRLSAVPLLNPDDEITRDQGISKRHAVRMNQLGSRAWCPQIRRTTAINATLSDGSLTLRDKVRAAINEDQARRINQYLVTEETWASFAIEGDRPTPDRSKRFYDILERATATPTPEITAPFLHAAQHALMEHPTFKDGNYRGETIWVGHREQGVGGVRAKVQYIAPKHHDVPDLMAEFLPIANDIIGATATGKLHPLIAASAISSGFVYIHPYVDGNGRLSRVLMQHALAAGDQQPDHRIIIPISAAIEREKQKYYDTLAVVSRTVMRSVQYDVDPQGEVHVHNDTKDLYRYPDLTAMTTYLGDRVHTAVERDLVDERRILTIYDTAQPALQRMSNLAQKDLDHFFRFCKQNQWSLSKNKRAKFEELTDNQITEMEKVLQETVANLSE